MASSASFACASRVRQRLRENAEVVGTDEAFFEDDDEHDAPCDLYNEKAGILDGEADTEVDLASYAYQIWKNAIDADPELQKTSWNSATSRTRRATIAAQRRQPQACWSTCARRTGTMRSPGSTEREGA